MTWDVDLAQVKNRVFWRFLAILSDLGHFVAKKKKKKSTLSGVQAFEETAHLLWGVMVEVIKVRIFSRPKYTLRLTSRVTSGVRSSHRLRRALETAFPRFKGNDGCSTPPHYLSPLQRK